MCTFDMAVWSLQKVKIIWIVFSENVAYFLAFLSILCQICVSKTSGFYYTTDTVKLK